MGEIRPLQLMWGPNLAAASKGASETLQCQGVLSSPSSILEVARYAVTLK